MLTTISVSTLNRWAKNWSAVRPHLDEHNDAPDVASDAALDLADACFDQGKVVRLVHLSQTDERDFEAGLPCADADHLTVAIGWPPDRFVEQVAEALQLAPGPTLFVPQPRSNADFFDALALIKAASGTILLEDHLLGLLKGVDPFDKLADLAERGVDRPVVIVARDRAWVRRSGSVAQVQLPPREPRQHLAALVCAAAEGLESGLSVAASIEQAFWPPLAAEVPQTCEGAFENGVLDHA